MSIGGVFLRFGSFTLRLLELCCAAIGVGIFSYFIAVLVDHNLGVNNDTRAVEGLTGAALIYTLFAVTFTLCLGGKAFFGYLAVILDLLFMGAFIAVAVLTRSGAHSCSGTVNTPLGTGNTAATTVAGNASAYVPRYGTACRLNTAVFAVSIVAAVLFLITAIWEVLMVRHHKKEKRYGPGPNNNYTEGTGKTPLWKRTRRNKTNKEVEAGVIGGNAIRPSHDTGTTIGNNAYAGVPEPKYEPSYGNTALRNEPAYNPPTVARSTPAYNNTSNIGNAYSTTDGQTAGAPVHAHNTFYDTATSGVRRDL